VAPDAGEDNFQGLGTIDVLILRCAPNPRDKVPATDYDSGAESDVLNNHLTEDEPGVADVSKEASKDKKKDSEDDKNGKADNAGTDGKEKKPSEGKKKGGNNESEGAAKGGGKGDGGEKAGKAKGGQADNNGKKAASEQGGKAEMGDKGPSSKQEKKPAEQSKKAKADDDDDGEVTSIAGYDGPADDYYYRGSQYYADPRWPGYAQSAQYGHPDPSAGAHATRPPPPQPQSKHVHWDMGQGHARPPEPQYHTSSYAQPQQPPGHFEHASYGHYPTYDYPQSHYQHQPPSYACAQGIANPYHNNYHCAPPVPPQGPITAQPTPAPSDYPPQAGYSHWSQHPVNVNTHAGQPAPQPAPVTQTSNEEAGGWKYVEPKRKAEKPPTISRFNGYEFDKKKGTWVQASGSSDGNSDKSDDDNKSNKSNKDGDWGTGTNGGNDQNTNSGWDNSNNDNNQNGNNEWNDNQNNTQSSNDPNSWQNSNGNTTSNDADRASTPANQSNAVGDSTPQDNASATPAIEDCVPRADRTLHGPLGAYFGPKIAVESDPNVPWIADEPPAYDLPAYMITKLGLSKQVQRGKGYKYVKKHRKPIYIDSIAEPYARFIFKYRTRDKLPRGFDKLEELEPTPDHMIQQLQEKKKEDLIAELQRWRLAYGDKAPERKVDLKPQKELDHQAWNLDLPKRDYLNYELPVQFPEETTASPTQQGGQYKWVDANTQNNAGQSGSGWDDNVGNNAKPPENQGWSDSPPTTKPASGNKEPIW
jgi:hypothetical protein